MTRTLVALALLPLFAGAQTSYHASPSGGAYGAGVVYEVVAHRRTVIYDFCAEPLCADGAAPLPTLFAQADGSLIGATSAGGGTVNGIPAAGVIFRLAPTSDGAWVESVVYPFCPWYDRCDAYGAPAAIWMDEPNVLSGLTQSADGGEGMLWRFKLWYVKKDANESFTRAQSWLK